MLAAVHNKPDKLLKINLGQEAIKATGIHRFWKVGQGWVMARDLKPRRPASRLGRSLPTVKVRESAIASEPVFNLKVMQAQSFFVGQRGMLVHDNSLVEPVLQPFDAMPELAAVVQGLPKSSD